MSLSLTHCILYHVKVCNAIHVYAGIEYVVDCQKIKPNVVTDCVGKYALSYDFKHFINSYTCRKNRTIRDVMCKLLCVIQVLYNMKTPSKFLANRLSLGHPSMWWLRYFLQCLALSVFSWCKRTDLFTKRCWC